MGTSMKGFMGRFFDFSEIMNLSFILKLVDFSKGREDPVDLERLFYYYR